ncbi:helix-turn-helix domain-containing protein [Bacillus sp. H-16]|uniref:helix-turn-helix domain-containing protein n=1 Tax=Alteribacter salitolerans TaxID=2912333 RepID=UPI0019660F9F|nr:helix-turn-helix domain-containing protein [Alteribacter salitolerans]MBM7094242.1 helix-turn-helix domain-containing protein [Alteribacter salitolerans]
MSELGLRLKSAREERGLSLEEMQVRTKIQKRYLIAIEEGAFDRLPGEFYARAFVKSYAESVGLDPELLFDEHKDELPRSRKEPTELPPRVSRKKSTETKPAPVKKNSRFSSLISTLVVAFIIIVFIVVLWLFNLDFEDSGAVPRDSETPGDFDESGAPVDEEEEPETGVESQEDGTEEDEEEAESEPDPQEEELEITEGSINGNQSELFVSGSGEYEVLLEFTANSWTVVQIDGEEVDQSTYSSGDDLSYELSAGQELFIYTGNAYGIDLTINDEPVEFPQERDVQRLTISFEDE